MSDYQAEIISIEIDLLVEHPSQAIVYEDKELEADFIASIKERGVLQPLIIASNATIDENGDIQIADDPSDPNIQYIVVSGHRRLNGANLAGLTEVPCILKQYEIPEEIKADFLLSNQYREKSKREKTNEFLEYKQLLSQVSKARLTTNSYADREKKINGLSRILESLNLDIDSKLNTVEVISERTGMSKYEQEVNTVIFDDAYQGKRLDKLYELGLSAKNGEEIVGKWQEVRELTLSGGTSNKEACDAIKLMLAELENKLAPKKAKEPKLKKEAPDKRVVFVVNDPDDAVAELLVFTNWKKSNPGNIDCGIITNEYDRIYDEIFYGRVGSSSNAHIAMVVDKFYLAQIEAITTIKSADVLCYISTTNECARVQLCKELASILGKKIISI